MFDILNIAIVLAFAFIGFYRGLVREIAALMILILAVGTALHFAIPLDFIISKSLPFPLFSTVISHLIIFATVLTTSKLFFLKTIIQHIRFLSTGADGMFGALFGALKGLMISVLLFSCLYVSGVANALKLESSWFYRLDRALYHKIAIFVTSNEVAILGKLKHVDNTEQEETKEEDQIILDNQNIENNIEQDSKSTETKDTNNLEKILSIMYEGGNLLSDHDYQTIVNTSSALTEEQIKHIFEICCKNKDEVKDTLNFNNDKLSVYIASLIFKNYTEENYPISKTQDVLIKKIDYILSEINSNKNVEKTTKPDLKNKKAQKISNSEVIVPVPVLGPNRKIKPDKTKIIKPKENIKTRVINNTPKVNNKIIKPKKIPLPKQKPAIEKNQIKLPLIKKSEQIVKKTEVNNYEESDDLRNDINALIEDSIKKN